MVGEKLGSFRIDGTLGVGAMGVVYQATHEPTGKPAAVKVVNKDIAQKGKTYERFQREAEILKQFRHPNIVRFLALGRYQGTSYIAMEFIPGKTLEQVLNERGALPWQEVVELGIQICDALHYAHEHGVVHRDLKPSNLMVTDDGQIEADRLRDRQGPRQDRADGHRPDPRHGRLHGPRADPRHARGQPQDRPVRARDRALPDAHRPAALRGVVGRRADALPPERAGARAQRQGRRDPQGARRPGRPAHGQVAHRPPLGRRGRQRRP